MSSLQSETPTALVSIGSKVFDGSLMTEKRLRRIKRILGQKPDRARLYTVSGNVLANHGLRGCKFCDGYRPHTSNFFRQTKVALPALFALASISRRVGLIPDCIPLAEVPHTSRLFADYLAPSPKLHAFYPSLRFHQNLAEFTSSVKVRPETRQIVAAVVEAQNRNFGASSATFSNIERFRNGAYAVVSGQQVGLFGGPLLAILKAAHAVRLARDLTQQGIDTVPIFWMASEDHDLAEVDHVSLPNPDFSLRRLNADVEGTAGAPMSDLRFSSQIEHVVEQAAELLGESSVTEILRESYRPGQTVSSAFGKLFARIFAPYGLVLLDPADAELHRLVAPLFLRAVTESSDLSRSLQERSKALEQAGYHEQVRVTANSVLLFAISGGARVPVQRQNGQYAIGKEKMSEQELLQRVEQSPQSFNANVLLRPVMQDTLLPTLAYIGGPAEVAYFAQGAVVYERLLGRVTPIIPRFSATIVEPKVEKLLQRYDLRFEDLYHGAEVLAEVLAQKTLPPNVDEQFRVALAEVTRSMLELKESLQRLDRTLIEAAERATSKMRYQVGRLHRRAARAALRRNQVLAEHARQLVDALYPDKSLQERTTGGVYFLARYGLELLETLVESAGTCPQHRILQV